MDATVVGSRASALDRRTLGTLCAATLLHFVVLGIYLSALPLYVHDGLAGSPAVVGIAVGSFFPAAVLLRPFIGRGLDRLGRKPFLAGAALLMGCTSVAFFWADSVAFVIVLRLLQGAAGAAFYSGAATVATDIAPNERRAEVIALFSLFLYGGFATGPVIGEGLVRAGFSWAWGVAALVSVAAVVMVARLPETMAEDDRTVPAAPDRSRLGLHRSGLAPGLVLMLAAVGYSSITSFSPLYARSIGMGASGGLYATFAITILTVRIATRKLADRHGRRAVALPGVAVATVGLALLALVPAPAAAYLGVGAYGIGFALIFPALMAFTADRVGRAERGRALASFTVFFDLGAGIGSYAVGYLAGRLGFTAAYLLPAILCGIAAGVLASERFSEEDSYQKTR